VSEIQELDVFVKPDGTVTLQVRGVKGDKCLTLTEGVEALLGEDIVERVYTDELNQADQVQPQEDVSRRRR
jgi:hypothetical protein